MANLDSLGCFGPSNWCSLRDLYHPPLVEKEFPSNPTGKQGWIGFWLKNDPPLLFFCNDLVGGFNFPKFGLD